MEILVFALILLGILFVLPIAAWVSARRTRRTVKILEQVVKSQGLELLQLQARVGELGRRAAPAEVPAPTPAPEPVRAAPPVRIEPEPPPPQGVPAQRPPSAPKPPASSQPLASPKPPASSEPPAPSERPASPEPARSPKPAASPKPPAPPEPPAPPRLPQPAAAAFDWEGLVGVKLFSAIAGIALVLAAILFLRYSIEHGWLQPPVRVAIGIIVAVALLVACELKAARRYPVTANAMDAAAIAILFSTFFAAHALWNLIPAIVAFGLLAVVTVIAVLLSIRRESLFIAVLGLLGGFATPALLSTGENRPIPLFAYLLLLNVGLAWVAYNKRWPALTWLTMILTTVYQWGWVFRFLDQNSLPLAMGIFLVFPVAAVGSLLLGGHLDAGDRGTVQARFEQSALISSALPLLFAIFLASVPAFGAQAALLFGFLALVDLGLLAIAIARRQELLHAAGAITTMIVMAIWITTSYRTSGSTPVVLGFTSLFVVIYLAAPLIANRFRRPFEGAGARAQFAASLLLFVFPLLAGTGADFCAALAARPDAARASRARRLASDRREPRRALLHGCILRRCDAGRMVCRTSHELTPWHRRCPLYALRRSRARRPGDRAACRAASAAVVGQWCGAAPQPWAAVLSLNRPAGAGIAVGAGAAARHHERRPLRRKRRRSPAHRLPDRQRHLVDHPRDVVGTRCGQRRRAAVADRRHRSCAGDAARARLVGSQGVGRLGARDVHQRPVPRPHGPPVPADSRHQPRLVAAAVAALWIAHRRHAGDDGGGTLDQDPGAPRRGNRGSIARHRHVVGECRQPGVGIDRGPGRGDRERVRAGMDRGCAAIQR